MALFIKMVSILKSILVKNCGVPTIGNISSVVISFYFFNTSLGTVIDGGMEFSILVIVIPMADFNPPVFVLTFGL